MSDREVLCSQHKKMISAEAMPTLAEFVRVEPESLLVRGPLNRCVRTQIRIQNLTKQRVAFCVKTTAPNSYVVRPNAELLEPEQQMEIDVEVQPISHWDTVGRGVANHRFLIIAMSIPQNATDRHAVWKNPELGKIAKQFVRIPVKFASDEEEEERRNSVEKQSRASEEQRVERLQGELEALRLKYQRLLTANDCCGEIPVERTTIFMVVLITFFSLVCFKLSAFFC